MAEAGLSSTLRSSLAKQEELLTSSLILNPVENFPFRDDIAVAAGRLHGLYNSDKHRARAQRLETPIQFAGREPMERDSRTIYSAWADAVGAADVTLRALSGLHAHIVLFMAMSRPGQTVMLLPVRAGGHLSGEAILERLGLQVIDMIVDDEGMRVDIAATLERCADRKPDFIFVDRSEGLTFEDFRPLVTDADAICVFDGSQYLSNIIAGDYPNPFNWGFDLEVASLHKNFPGPQKALIATRRQDEAWGRILGGLSNFVSNMHTASTYAAGLTLSREGWLAAYSKNMLDVAVALEDGLHDLDVPVVKRSSQLLPTHHIWIREADRERAFSSYERLEQCLIMTNFRVLPYSLGYGLRLGVSAAVRLGMTTEDVPRLAELIAHIRRDGATPSLRREAGLFSRRLWERNS